MSDNTWPRPIPVTERLPEDDNAVLITYFEYSVCGRFKERVWGVGHHESGMWFGPGDEMPLVTHWLPLPPDPTDDAT